MITPTPTPSVIRGKLQKWPRCRTDLRNRALRLSMALVVYTMVRNSMRCRWARALILADEPPLRDEQAA